jgi:hypothetical protein
MQSADTIVSVGAMAVLFSLMDGSYQADIDSRAKTANDTQCAQTSYVFTPSGYKINTNRSIVYLSVSSS